MGAMLRGFNTEGDDGDGDGAVEYASRRHGESVVYISVRHLYSNSCT